MERDEIERGAAAYAALAVKPLAQRIKRGDLTLISLGPQCATASVLRRLNLRQAAYPFDWLFSSLEMAGQCLEDDFRSLLDPAQYESCEGGTEHRLYRDRFGIERVFNHHQMPADLGRYQRRVGRFRSAPNPVYLHLIRDEPDPEMLAKVRRQLRGPLLTVLIRPGGRPDYGLVHHWPIAVFHSRADLGPLGFHDLADEIAFAAWLGCRLQGAHEDQSSARQSPQLVRTLR